MKYLLYYAFIFLKMYGILMLFRSLFKLFFVVISIFSDGRAMDILAEEAASSSSQEMEEASAPRTTSEPHF